ncbi:hypothetical protein [Neobacillus niacini]|uniref:hypothetical protein n=1 Tax=Neobacillus niacini TaxID=86668 RepID=UPI00203EFC6B|nr:hypothetical protein [Neobacillus niacini]MCM3690828.1 hypothetical protein [Neobacillus niacini]
MKINQHLLFFVMLIILLTSFLFPSKPLATSWAYPFVVWQDYIYVVSDEDVTEINRKIGQVTKYSDMKSYSGNFSNTFKKGTKYYSIKGISTDEAIAIEESNGRYIRANREGKYEVRSAFDGYFDGQQGIIKIFIFLMIGLITVILIYKFKKNNR